MPECVSDWASHDGEGVPVTADCLWADGHVGLLPAPAPSTQSSFGASPCLFSVAVWTPASEDNLPSKERRAWTQAAEAKGCGRWWETGVSHRRKLLPQILRVNSGSCCGEIPSDTPPACLRRRTAWILHIPERNEQSARGVASEPALGKGSASSPQASHPGLVGLRGV